MAPKRWGRKDKDGSRVVAEDTPAVVPVLPVRRRDLNLPQAVCVLFENYFKIEESQRYMEVLRHDFDWRRREVTLNHISTDKKTVDEPRMTMFMADPGICYYYSGRDNVGMPWHPAILEIKAKAEAGVEECGLPATSFNCVQMNRYDSPRHSLGMHADNEADLVRGAPIASVSFGCTRDFRILRKGGDERSAITLELCDGAFMVMGGDMQEHYLHGVPMGGDKGQAGLRFNLTFRICHRRQTEDGIQGPPPALTSQAEREARRGSRGGYGSSSVPASVGTPPGADVTADAPETPALEAAEPPGPMSSKTTVQDATAANTTHGTRGSCAVGDRGESGGGTTAPAHKRAWRKAGHAA
eukprot:TRINITY_DN62340_c0_g1_i1.p2 TRINITY_DN62340_c0_g1~~TRINITY_DN62340_c0_g1_i1.p2  ORF type:complete len:355 (+),score=59.92 TRINITY_DN62340_c0_g1_i1:41-1105(+)